MKFDKKIILKKSELPLEWPFFKDTVIIGIKNKAIYLIKDRKHYPLNGIARAGKFKDAPNPFKNGLLMPGTNPQKIFFYVLGQSE